MVRIQVEISASVGGRSVGFGGHCSIFPDDHNIQEDNHTAGLFPQ
jgi:hypothetical protein